MDADDQTPHPGRLRAPQSRPRPAARYGAAKTCRIGPTWSCRRRRYSSRRRYIPKVLVDDLMQPQRARSRRRVRVHQRRPAGPLRRLQRHRRRRRPGRVLRARRQLDQPHDPRRQPAGDGVTGRARGPARQGPVHLPGPALRHQVQLQLPVVHHQPRCDRMGKPTT